MDPPTSSADLSAPSWSIPESVVRRQILLNRMQLQQHGVGTVTAGAMWQSGGEQGATSAALLGVLEGNSSSGGGGGGDALQELKGLLGAHLDRVQEWGEEKEEEAADGEAEGGRGSAIMRGGDSMEASYQAHDQDGEPGAEAELDAGDEGRPDESAGHGAGRVNIGDGGGGGSVAVVDPSLLSRHRPSSVEKAELPRTTAAAAVGDLNSNAADASLRLLRSLVSALPQQPSSPSSMQAAQSRPPLFPPAIVNAAGRVDGEAPAASSGDRSQNGLRMTLPLAPAAGASAGDHRSQPGVRMTLPLAAALDGDDSYAHQQCGPIAAVFSQRFPAYGVGLIDSLLVLDEQVGASWEGGGLSLERKCVWWGGALGRGGVLMQVGTS